MRNNSYIYQKWLSDLDKKPDIIKGFFFIHDEGIQPRIIRIEYIIEKGIGKGGGRFRVLDYCKKFPLPFISEEKTYGHWQLEALSNIRYIKIRNTYEEAIQDAKRYGETLIGQLQNQMNTIHNKFSYITTTI